MNLVLSEGEKVVYDREYCKGRKRSTSKITITNKRLINTVESKYGVTKREIKVDDVGAVRVKFKPTSVLAFVLTGIYGLFAAGVKVFEKLMNDGATVPEDAMFNGGMSSIYIAYLCVFLGLAVISFIVGLFSLRNGYYLVVKTKPCEHVNCIALSSAMGSLKPLKLKPGKAEAFEMMDTIPAALASIEKEKRETKALEKTVGTEALTETTETPAEETETNE